MEGERAQLGRFGPVWASDGDDDDDDDDESAGRDEEGGAGVDSFVRNHWKLVPRGNGTNFLCAFGPP